MIVHKWTLLALALLAIVQCGVAQRAFEDVPKLVTQNGNLVIESGLDKNITLKTNGRGFIFANGVNLIQPVSYAGNNGSFLSYVNVMTLRRRMAALERSMNAPRRGVMPRLRILENQTRSDAPTRNPRMRAMNRRLTNLETKVQQLMDKLVENNCKSNPCQNGGVCMDLFDDFLCECTSNWEGSTCVQDVNECARFAGTDLGCQNGATCVNTPGAYHCLCANGFQGIHCTRKTLDCTRDSREMCGNGICVPTDSAFKCICDQGWTTDGVNVQCTVDVDECALEQPHCSKDPLVQCLNTPGSFRCGPCPAGYTGNGYYCADVDECSHNNGGCSVSPMVQCINTRGSSVCGHCPLGYVGDGRTCTLFSSGSTGLCATRNICHRLARCEEVGGTINCYCPATHTGNGIGPGGCVSFSNPICEPNPCKNGGSCVALSTIAFTCLCKPGFDSADCTAPNLCTPNPCLNGGICMPHLSTGNYSCHCINEFSGPRCNTQRPSCGGVLNARNGTLRYPANENTQYSSNLRCAWMLRTDTSMVLNVTFIRFDLEKSETCRFDWLQIHDGRSSAAHLIGRFCGDQLPMNGNFLSTRDTLYMWFRSDSSRHHSGFELRWESTSPVCGFTKEFDTYGTLVSPGSPGEYPPNRDCWWTLIAPAGKRIQFHFFTLSIEAHPDCEYDYLAIHDGAALESPLLAQFCNTSHPSPLITPGNTATVHFHSDADSTDTGFQVHYSVVEGFPGCGGIFTTLEGEFGTPMQDGSYPHNLECDYQIKLPPGQRVSIQFSVFDIESSHSCNFDHLELYEGSSSSDPLVRRMCGSNMPDPYESLGNQLLLRFRSDYSNSHQGFRVRYRIVCGGVFNNETGILTSPNYPNEYHADRVCNYEVRAPLGKSITLDWLDFDVEGVSYPDCAYDYVQVYDGIVDDTMKMGRYCSDIIPPRMVSSYNALTLELVSDTSIGGRGFKANYTFTDMGCGGVLKESGQSVTPPMNGNSYKHNLNCTWFIVAPVNHTIQLSFTAFNLEDFDDCGFDYVAIYDGLSDTEMVKFCGSTIPPPLTSNGNILKVRFVSDPSTSEEGFTFNFIFEDSRHRCGGNLYGASGAVKSPGWPKDYPLSRECVWIIRAPDGQQIELRPLNFSLESHMSCLFDYLIIRNGATATSPLLGKYCGDEIPKLIRSVSNQLYIQFVTDSSRSGPGFYIEWDSTATGCGGILTSYRGSIASPNYPEPYGVMAVCVYKITVSQGSTINITFTDLDLESQGSCVFDYVEVFDGQWANARTLGKVCSGPPPQYLTVGNSALIRFVSDSSDSGRGFLLEYETICNRTITGYSGVIESPNFPNAYPHFLDCEWEIRAPLGNRIAVEFSHFDMETMDSRFESNQCFDYLEIVQKDDNSGRETESKKYCNSMPTPMVSLGRSILFRLHTDVSNAESGFRLEWRVSGCGGLLTHPRGTLQLGENAAGHHGPIECLWVIRTAVGNSIELQIDSLDIPTEDCNRAKLLVMHGETDDHPIATICHPVHNATVHTSHRHEMYVKLVWNDRDVPSTVLNASYRVVDSVCGGKMTKAGKITSPNYPKNYDSNGDCEWLLTTDETHTLTITIEDVDLEESEGCIHDYLKIYDGSTYDDNNLILAWCNTSLPSKVVYTTTSNAAVIRFVSDSTVEAKGFLLSFDTTCGSIITTNSTGMISRRKGLSAGNCTWVISTPDPMGHISLTTNYYVAQDGDDPGLFIFEVDPRITSTTEYFYGAPETAIKTVYSRGNTLRVLLLGKANTVYEATYSVFENFCGGEFRSLRGVIASPLSPMSYPNNIECVYNVTVAPGNRLQLKFTFIDIEQSENCNEDYLELREGSGGGRFLRVFCGKHSNLDPIETNGSIWMKFRSNEDTVGLGFSMEHSYVKNVELLNGEGVITSPLYPDSLVAADTYTYRITVTFGLSISLTFDDFRFPKTSTGICSSGMQIYDGYNENAPELLSLQCGYTRPEQIVSSANVLYIRVTYNARVGSKFKLSYREMSRDLVADHTDSVCNSSTITAKREQIPFSSPGYPLGYAPMLNCSWIVKPSDPQYHAYFVHTIVDLEQTPECLADALTVYESQDLEKWNKIQSTCSHVGSRVYHGTPYLMINFKTDFFTNRTGFTGFLAQRCGGRFTAPSGIINMSTPMQWNRDPNAFCDWYVSVRNGRRIQFTFDQFKGTAREGESRNTYISFKNGPDEHSPKLGLGTYSGPDTPVLNATFTNKAFVRFSANIFSTMTFVLRYQEVGFECGGDIMLTPTANSTIITSPHYPNVPDGYTECVWKVITLNGQLLQVEFQDRFDLMPDKDCEREYVEIMEGATALTAKTARYCSGTRPELIRTESNILRLTYFTSVANPKNGFKARISFVGCGATYFAPTGVISTPSVAIQMEATDKKQCEYRIIGTIGKQLNITFEYIDLPRMENRSCLETHRIEILAVVPQENGTYMFESRGVFCNAPSESIILDTNKAIIVVSSQFPLPTSYQGYKLRYAVTDQRCGAIIEQDSGVIANYGYPMVMLARQFCEWRITVPKGRRVKVKFIDLDLLNSTAHFSQRLAFYNDFKYNSRIAFVRGDVIPAPIYATDNTMMINFWVRIGSTNRGFKLEFSSDEPSLCVGDINESPGLLEAPGNITSFYCDYHRDNRPFFADSNLGTISFRVQNASIGRFLTCRVSATKMQITWPSAPRPDMIYMAHLCGNISDVTVMSPYPDTRLEVKQSVFFGSVSYKLYYQVDKCGEVFSGPFTIQSPVFANRQDPVNCAWAYINAESQNIQLNVSNVRLTGSCDDEYINIYNGPTQTAPLLTVICSNVTLHETVIQSKTSYLFVEYHTNSYNPSSQFTITGKTLTDACGGTLLPSVPRFKSPGNGSYPDNMECIWDLTPESGFAVGLTFIDRFYIEESVNCSKDHIEIFDYMDQNWVSLGRLCGRMKPGTYNATESKLRVVFRTDDSIAGDGFTIAWQQNCGGVYRVSEATRTIISPKYPQNYMRFLNCTYTLVAPADKFINVRFKHFDLEEGYGVCHYDNVTIKYKADYISPELFLDRGIYCGKDSPGEFRYKEKVMITFRTDRWVEKTGFEFDFELDSCGGLITNATAIRSATTAASKYPSQQVCVWNITAPVTKAIVIRFETFELEYTETCYSDWVSVYKGSEKLDSKRVAQLCGNLTQPPIIKIDQSDAIVEFRSDYSTELRGFSALVMFVPQCDRQITLTADARQYQLSIKQSDYDDQLDCHFQVNAPPAYVIRLEFSTFHLAPCDSLNSTTTTSDACGCDYLEVRDGKSPFAELVTKSCGHQRPPPITTSRSGAYLRLVTDTRRKSVGFDVNIRLEMGACGETVYNVSENEAVLQTANYPNNYPNNLDCTWTVVGKLYNTMQLHFEAFDVENGTSANECNTDYVEIVDAIQRNYVDEGLGADVVFSGQQQSQAEIPFYTGIRHAVAPHIYCGSRLPPRFLSRGNKVHVRFHSNGAGQRKGFKIVAEMMKQCIQDYEQLQGRLYSNNAETCQMTIRVPENYTIALYFHNSYFFGGGCDKGALKVYDGETSNDKQVLSLCDYDQPNPIFSSSNKLFIDVKGRDPSSEHSMVGSYDITYVATDKGPGCGGTFFNYGGIFTSPLYPSVNRTDIDCRWDIIVPVNLKVALRFSVFDLGSRQFCPNDYVALYETDNGIDKEVSRFCGEDNPAPYIGSKNTLSVRFVKTVNFSGTGFKAEFMAVHHNANVTNY